MIHDGKVALAEEAVEVKSAVDPMLEDSDRVVSREQCRWGGGMEGVGAKEFGGEEDLEKE